MPVLAPKIIDYIITVSPKTPLIEVINLAAKNSCSSIYGSCIFVVENGRPLGFVREKDLLSLMASGRNIASVELEEIMSSSAISLNSNKSFEADEIFAIMRSHDLSQLPITNDIGKIVGAVNLEDIISELQSEILKLKQQLQTEIGLRYSAEIALNNATEEIESLANTNQQLQHINEGLMLETLEYQQIEQELQTSQERYARAIDACKMSIWEWNIQDNHILIDSNLKSLLDDGNQNSYQCFHEWLNLIHPDDVDAVKLEINAYLEGLMPKYEIEHRIKNLQNNYSWILARGELVRDAKGNPCLMTCLNTDITAYKAREMKLKSSLKEKELLLKEIHHRVKNNLQVISSLLRLQAGYIQDTKTLNIFQDSQNRVRAMAMIHENLYQSSKFDRIDFSNYIQNLTSNLVNSYRIDKDIDICLKIDKICLHLQTAIPCGLIINELVCNSIKHAFPHEQLGKIYIELLEIEPKKYSLTVSDNGIGIPEDIEQRKNQSLGLELVWNLVEQLEGSVAYKNQSGTAFQITFFEFN